MRIVGGRKNFFFLFKGKPVIVEGFNCFCIVGQARWASGRYPLLILSPQPKKSRLYHLQMIETALFGLRPDFFF